MVREEHDFYKYLADIICSRHNQHCIVRIVGLAGTGKSWAAIRIAMEVSKIVAERKNGKPEDFYNFHEHMAVMSKQRIKKVMDKPRRYCILHLDDVGVPLNSRKFMSADNIDFNNIIQTFRPNNNLVIMTLQAGFLMDKVPRSLAHIEIEMESNLFDAGCSIAKVQRIVYKHKSGAFHFPYIVDDFGCKIIRHVFEKPQKKLTDAYEIERAKQLAAMNQEDEPIIKTEKPIEISNKEKAIQAYQSVEAKKYPSLRIACADLNVDYPYTRWLKSTGAIVC